MAYQYMTLAEARKEGAKVPKNQRLMLGCVHGCRQTAQHIYINRRSQHSPSEFLNSCRQIGQDYRWTKCLNCGHEFEYDFAKD